jgi:DNA gyrase subunit A
VVREHHQLVFISQNGMVQRIAVRDFRPLGRNAQGFRLMNIRDDDRVSAIALVMEDEAATAASAETIDPATLATDTAVATEVDELAEAGPADPTDPTTITPPEVDAEDIEP